MASTWGTNSWGDNSWQSDVITETLTGLSASFSIGNVVSFPEQGWGGDTWGTENWGESAVDVFPTGFELTSSLGTIDAFPATGWGGLSWGTNNYNDLTNLTLTIDGFEITSSVGDIEAYNEVGWGHDGWGEEAWGQANDVALILTGQSATSSTGNLNPADVEGITGQEATTSIGSATMIGDVSVTPTGQSATASQGSLSPADVMGITGQSATSSVGSLSPADVMGLTGVSASVSLGDVSTNSNPIIDLTGQSMTGSTGTLNPADVFGINGNLTTSPIFTANGDAQLSTTQKKFGTASLLVDGTGDFVKSNNSNVIEGNFTIEFFAYASSFAQDAVIWDNRVANSGFAIGTNTSSQVIIYADGSAVATGFSGFNNNAFNHIAFVRNSGVLTVYVNGTARGTAQTYNTDYIDQPYYIGCDHTETDFFNGFVDEFRASTVARYTSAFTPPSSAFTVDNDTNALLHFDGANGSTTITNAVPSDFIFQLSTNTGSLSTVSDVDVIPNGQSATASVAAFGTAAGFGIQAYSDVDTGSNSSYTDVATGSNTSYTDAA